MARIIQEGGHFGWAEQANDGPAVQNTIAFFSAQVCKSACRPRFLSGSLRAANHTKQEYYGCAPMRNMSHRSDPLFRGALWIVVISWVTIVLLVFAFYFSVLFLNSLFQH